MQGQRSRARRPDRATVPPCAAARHHFASLGLTAAGPFDGPAADGAGATWTADLPPASLASFARRVTAFTLVELGLDLWLGSGSGSGQGWRWGWGWGSGSG